MSDEAPSFDLAQAAAITARLGPATADLLADFAGIVAQAAT